jgi:hypothetical protein
MEKSSALVDAAKPDVQVLVGQLAGALWPAVTVWGQALPSLRVKVTELRGPETAGVLNLKL